MNWITGTGTALKHALLTVVMLALVACETVQTTQGGVVGVTRQQRMAIGAEEITQAAGKEYAELIAEQRRKGNLNQNASHVRRVRSIVNDLIPHTTVFRPDARSWQWEANVLQSPDVNAWVMPGGKIAVNSGLIEKLQVTDAELAAVIGHEIAHALREHARERISEQIGAGLIASGVDMVASIYGLQGAGNIANTGLQLIRGLPHSRLQETEADRIGVELAARAGYDPRAAISLWQKMASASGAQPLEFLSTHPSREDRLRDLANYAQRVMPLYQQASRR
jgi:predicted Zn-dependent protease